MVFKGSNNRGFTLIELLVVISIISLLSSVVLSSLNTARVRARDAKRALSVRQLKTAIESYYSYTGAYPSVGSDNAGYAISSLSAVLVPTYMPSIPSDPTTGAWEYVRGPATDNSYGLKIYRETTSAYCGTGTNFNSGWWSIGANMCPF